ncbi:MAG: winged helix-turn-helix domain-containing protein, partial [Burkholderiales bacterium]
IHLIEIPVAIEVGHGHAPKKTGSRTDQQLAVDGKAEIAPQRSIRTVASGARNSSCGTVRVPVAAMPRDSREVLRFRDFELDLAAYELRRKGRAVRLERQPMDLLILLVERRRELVSRSEIIERLWGKDVLVDVDTGVQYGHLVFLPVDSKWDAFRTDPRFVNLMERCGCTPAARPSEMADGRNPDRRTHTWN